MIECDFDKVPIEPDGSYWEVNYTVAALTPKKWDRHVMHLCPQHFMFVMPATIALPGVAHINAELMRMPAKKAPRDTPHHAGKIN